MKNNSDNHSNHRHVSNKKRVYVSDYLKSVSSNSYTDLLVILLFSFVFYALAINYNAFEQLYSFSRAHEELELDELFTLMMILSVALGVYSIRRVIELKKEVVQRKLSEEHVRQLAYFDSLTGLPNRALLKDRLIHIMQHAKRREILIAILFVDLDGFKSINDNYGHEAGDQVLKNVAERLNDSVRSGDTVSRLAGDEFIVVIEGVSSVDEMRQIIERVHSALSDVHQLDDNEVFATPSIGVSVYPDDGEKCDMLIRNADRAMYEAKSKGKSQIQFFNVKFKQV